MPLTLKSLRSAAGRTRPSRIAKSLTDAKAKAQQTAFLCHSHSNGVLAERLQVLLAEQGASKNPTLRIGFRAEWDANEEESNTVCGFPDHGWKSASKEQREALRLVWLPAYRDPAKLIQLAALNWLTSL